MATGVFHTARTGANLRSRKYRGRRNDTFERFAEALADHDTGKGDPGGSVVRAASAVGISTRHGYQMLARLKQGLGPQAC